jgi:predicted TPR repeat methyltransferase
VTTAAERLQEAIARHRAGDHAGAEGVYREHLRQFPDDASALHFLGLLRNQQGRNNEGIALMLAALEADPSYVDAWSNLGIVYYQERDLVRSEKCCRKAIELAPGFANAWANLARTLRAKDSLEEALHALGRALELDPRMRGAALSYGQLLYRLDRLPQALEFYRNWLARSPDDPIAQHMLAACGGEDCPRRASDSYVRSVFDDFAESFDRSLQLLQYQAPRLLYEAVTGSGALPRAGTLDILDLGCGTGLCGPLLRPVARHLVGVDLSPKMLSLAAARGLYDQLNCAELTEWLATCRSFDLVMAADVLCYFGDLELALARVRAILTSGGCFACSLEAAPAGSSQPFVLCPHGRYQHQRAYIEGSLARAGLQAVRISEAVLRYERQEPVVGHLVVARVSPDVVVVGGAVLPPPCSRAEL